MTDRLPERNCTRLPVLALLLTFLLPALQLSLLSKDRDRIALLMDVGFAKGQFPANFPPMPKELSLDIYITNNAFYKLYYKEAMITTGSLKKGDNHIFIPGELILKKSGTFIFRLETLTTDYRFLYDITIHNRLSTSTRTPGTSTRTPGTSSGTPGSQGQPPSLNFFSLSESKQQYVIDLYVRGHRAGNSRKQVFQGLPESQRKIIRNIIGVKHPRAKDNPNTISIPKLNLSLVGPLAYLYNKLKKTKKKRRIPKARIVTLGFRTVVTGSPSKRVHGKLAITYQVVKNKRPSRADEVK